MKRVDTVVSYGMLTPLAVAVLLLHWLLLQSMVSGVALTPATAGRTFSTRTIESQPLAKAPLPRPVRKAVAAAPAAPSPVQQADPALELPPAVPQPLETPVAGAQLPGNGPGLSADPVSPESGPAEPELQVMAPRNLREDVAWASRYVIPASLNLQYDVSSNKFPFRLNAELGWQQDGASYDAKLSFGAFGLRRVQTSRGQITVDGLAPLRFSDKYRSEVAAHFVREKGLVTFSANTPDAPLLAGAQDRLSVVLQLAAMIAGDPERFPRASTVTLQIIGPRDADIWLFTVEEDETLNLPGGQQATRKLVRNPRREFDQRVELWLAPALGYLPARIRITEANGDYIDQKWLSSEAPG
jgi:hypothetical protein